MKIVLGTKASGKTTELVKEVARDPDCVLVTFNQQRKKMLETQYTEIRGRVRVWSNLKTEGGSTKRYYLDDLNDFLKEYFKGQVVGYSINLEDVQIVANIKDV